MVCLLSLGYTGCSEKQENQLGSNEKDSMFELAINSFKKAHPEATVMISESENLEVRTSDCKPTSNADCPSVFISGLIIQVDGCPVTVSFWAQLCFVLGNITLVGMWDLNYTFTNNPDCNLIRQKWSQMYKNGRIGELEASMDDFHRKVSRVTEYNFVVTVLLEPIPCNSQGAHNVATFYERDCHTLCVTTETISGEIVFNLHRIKCGEACCRRITPYCVSNGVWVPAGPPTVQAVGNPACDPVNVTCNGIQVPNASYRNPCTRL